MVAGMSAEPTQTTPYDLLGGEAAVRQLANRFYDFMETLPEAAELRAMHGPDLGPMREKLFQFMSGWLGGPPLYFQRADAKCFGSAHRPFPIDAAARDQWMLCITRALDEMPLSVELRTLLDVSLKRTTEALRNC
jgi:hemoglobin